MTYSYGTKAVVRLEHVSFSHPGQPRALFNDVNLSLTAGWCGIVGANGAGKSTLLTLIAGLREPHAGHVHGPPGFYCAQQVDAIGTIREDVTACWDSRAMKWRALLSLDDADLWRWESCSSGERKRWQVAHALMQNPELLLLDEPTNHLDVQAKAMLRDALQDFRGCGVIVSHDRDLLDALTQHTLWVETDGEVTLYPAAYSEAARLRAARRSAYLAERDVLKGRVSTLKAQREYAAQAHAAANAQISTRRRMTSIKDHDARSTAAKGRAINAEKSLGRRLSTTNRALTQAHDTLVHTPFKPSYDPTMHITHVDSPHRIIAHLEWADGVRAGSELLLEPGSLTWRRDSRLWLRGPNGSGKTTLIRMLHEAMSTSRREHVLWMPQHLDESWRARIARDLSECARDPRARWLLIAASLGVDVEVVLAQGVEAMSPGSLRKFLMAQGLMKQVWGMVLDEPTNHLDLPSIKAMEGALRAYGGALCVVTHDEVFGAQVTTQRVEIDLQTHTLLW